VAGRVLATSNSHIPVPVAKSAIFKLGERSGMLGWTRNPSIAVVVTCCSLSLSTLVSPSSRFSWQI